MKCFYHNDMDGHAAAAVVAYETKNYNREDFFEIDYVSPIPVDMVKNGETVYFVDYSFSESNLKYLDELIKKECYIIWIDHHKSSLETMKNHPEYKDLDGMFLIGVSGALLTWRWFHQGAKEEPEVLQLVSDYDCWKFKYGDKTTYFKLGIDCTDSDPLGSMWKQLIYEDRLNIFITKTIKNGMTVKSYVDNQNTYYREHYGYESELDGYKCFVLALKTNSWVFGEKYNEYPLCAAWVFNGEKYVYTLYSSKKDVDCSEIARKYGGGGHAGAAGFTTNELILKKK